MQKMATKLSLLLVLLSGIAKLALPLSLDLIGTSVGSWIVVPRDKTDSDLLSFAKLGVQGYFTVAGVKGFASVPLALTAYFRDGSVEQARYAPGDLRLYAGYPIGFVEPRVGVVIPLYSTSGTWIGSGDFALTAGAGFNAAIVESRRWTLAGDFALQFSLGGRNSFANLGSIVVPMDIKGTFRPSDSFKAGVEILASASRMRWSWNNGALERSASIVPHLFTEVKIAGPFYLGAKVGVGPGWKRKPHDQHMHKSGTNSNYSLSLSMYPN